jgi:hypothetical protein
MTYVFEILDDIDKKDVLEWEKRMTENEKHKEDFIKKAEKIMKDDNILHLEDMTKDELKEMFPEYDPNYDYNIDENNITCFDSNIVYYRLSNVFQKILYKLYNYIQIQNSNYKKCQLVREFIWWHENREYCDLHTLFNMNPELYLEHITTSKREMDEIKKQGLIMFLSDKCVNVDENEDNFDNMNELMVDEWEIVHNIILYNYYYYT